MTNGKLKPTEKELEILQVLWNKGPCTVREVYETVHTESQTGYTTTLKFMQIMHEKGFVSRVKKGKTHIYKAEISESNTQEHLYNKLLNSVFKGSAASLIMHALGNSKTSKKDLERIQKYIDNLDKEIE